MSKGSKPRPSDVERFNLEFDRIFGEKKPISSEELKERYLRYLHEPLAKPHHGKVP